MSERGPNKALAGLLAFVLPPGVGHAYVGRVRRGAFWFAGCLAAQIAVPALLPWIASALGGGAGLWLLVAALLLPWLGPAIDVLIIPRARYGETRTTALVLFLAFGIVGAIAVRVVARAFLVEAFKVPSGAMIPTILVGDHLFVDKSVYRRREPRYGEVMVFAFPEHPEQDFIKRVVALPGDQLDVKDGHPVLNGWAVPFCKLGHWEYEEAENPGKHEGDLDVEFLGDQAYLTFYDASAGAFTERQGPYHAKPGEYWVMGDNRNNSHDSRMWFGGVGGGVPRDLLRGRALFVWLSVGAGGVEHARTGQPVHGPTLPRGAESLQPALDACLKSRPPLGQTTPPPPMR